ncbi:uncharacterized protein LOC126092651 [Schistocerca cancellata]|uniref:uncharacterized protein LOC126092651 n=1 Tax=Schistocerca cancellata TaxID=274614 RepID=UPI002117C264|nr:uncharacterized protein LOC126092651 [Schistocerca cancellata]
MSPWKLCLLVALAAVVCPPAHAATAVPAPPKPDPSSSSEESVQPAQAAAAVPAPRKPYPSSSSEESVHPASPKAPPYPSPRPIPAAAAAPPNPAPSFRHAPTPQPAPAAIDPTPYLSCSNCGRFNAVVTALLRAVYALLLALLNDVNTALCYTLHLVYILLCILQQLLRADLTHIVIGIGSMLKTSLDKQSGVGNKKTFHGRI